VISQATKPTRSKRQHKRRFPAPLTRAQQDLFDSNLNYIRAFARNYAGLLPLEDARQEALIGLLEAVRAWSPRSGGIFRAFASRVVNCRLLDACRRWDVLTRIQRRRVRDGLASDVSVVYLSELLRDRVSKPSGGQEGSIVTPKCEGLEFCSRELDPADDAAVRELLGGG
jgi:DNA-directed RNA polymerase specialized sigma24 family protein